MKRSGFSKPGKPLARGNAKLVQKTPLARGNSQLARSTGLQRGTSTLTTTTPLPRSTKPMAPIGARAKRMRQGKVAPTAAEQAWMDKARAFGCIVCHLYHNAPGTPAVIHHPLAGGRRKGHLSTLPLCDPGHHQNSPTPAKISRHPDKARFEEAYGTEAELLATLQALLETPI